MTGNKRQSIISSVAVVTGFSVATRLIAFLFKVFVSRELGAEAVGVYQMALSVYFMALTVAASGIPTVLSRKIAEDEKYGGRRTPSYVTSAFLITVCSSLAVMAVLYPVATFLPSAFPDERVLPLVTIMLPALISTSVYNVVRSWFWGRKSFIAFSFTETLEEILRIAFTLVFSLGIIRGLSPVKGLSIGFLISDVICALVLVAFFFIRGGRPGKPAYPGSLLRPSLPLTATRIFGGAVGAFTALIIPLMLVRNGMSNAEASATFGRVTGMAMPLLMAPTTLTGALAVVLIPEIATLSKSENDALSARIDGSINFSVIISSLFIILYVPLGKEISVFVFNDVFSGEYLSNAALLLYPIGLNQITASVLNSMGYEKKSFVHYAIGAALLLVCLIVLPGYIGIYAVAAGSGLCFAVSSAMNLFLINKKANVFRTPGKTLLSLLFVFPAVAIAFLLKNILLSRIPLFFVIAISGGIPALLYAACIVAFRIVDVSRFYQRLNGKFSKKRDTK